MKLALLTSLFVMITGCDDGSGTHKPFAEKPEIKRTSEPTATEVATVYADVRPIFAAHCSACHPARNGPDWLDYSQAKRYADNNILFRRVVTEKSMPPSGSPQAASITSGEREAIGRWASAGAPEHVAAATTVPTAASKAVAPLGLKDVELIFPIEARSCLNCHGLDGPQADGKLKIPRLAGQNAPYLLEQLQRFKWRERIDPTNTMNEIAGELSNEVMESLSKYFATRPAFGNIAMTSELTESESKLFNRGHLISRQYCVQCHMNPMYPRGTADPKIPALAGQSEQYLRNQLLYFRDNERQSPLMHEYAKELKNSEIEALAFYFALVRQTNQRQ